MSEEEAAKFAAIVASGGIYWSCSSCKNTGVIHGCSTLAQDTRKRLKVDPPDPCEVTFTRGNCPVCNEVKDEEAEPG